MNKTKLFLVLVFTIFLSGCMNESYTVNFLDYDGNIIKSVVVKNGDEVNPPDLGERTGYAFVCWDKDYTNISENLNIRPVFTTVSFKVTFKDVDGKIIEEQNVKNGEDAIAPTVIPPLGYRFVGWDNVFINITESLEIKAIYEKETYTITFETFSENLIPPLENLEYGSCVDLPIPEKSGYLFTGWYLSNDDIANNFTNQNPITKDITLYAKYRITYLKYYIEDSSIIIHGFQGNHTEVEIPSLIEGLPVTTINKNAFFGNQTITKLSIPNTVTCIGDFAFSKMTSLLEIEILSNEVVFGEGILKESMSLQKIIMPGNASLTFFYGGDSGNIPNSLTLVKVNEGSIELANDFIKDSKFVTEVIIPSTVKTIGQYSFANTKIEIIDLTNNLELIEIGNYAFARASMLKKIDLPSSLLYIGESAFSNTLKLTSINIPESVVSIGNYAFEKSALSTITLPEGLQTLGVGAFKEVASLQEVSLPPAIVDINDQVFQSTYSLLKVTLSENTIRIGKNSFSNCPFLNNINFPSTLTNIDDYAFISASSLAVINLPDSLLRIGNYAFSGCNKLSSVILPKNVAYVGYNAFSNDAMLTSFTFSADTKLKKIEPATFAGCINLKMIEIADGITSIGDYAFSGCGALINISLPNTLTSIGVCAFVGATNITSIVIPSSVISIGNYAFQDVSQLLSIKIMREAINGITNLGTLAFSGTNSNFTIYVPENSLNIYMEAENWITYKNFIKKI